MTTLRDETMRAHPEFPWLEAGDAEGVMRALTALGWLEPGERVVSAARAGEGNMNLTLRIVTDRRTFVLKQARPWVEKYPEIPAPWDRSEIEQRFYARVADLPAVASRMPRLLARHPEHRLLAIEALVDARDMTSLYTGDAPSPDELDALADYLAALHAGTRVGADAAPDPAFANRAMRALNHEHVFRLPLDPENGLDLDRHEPGLRAAADRLIADPAFRERVGQLGRIYLEDGRQLVHGDFFPGSWMRTRAGLRVIDPEFAHTGAPELDLGGAIAHLALARRPLGEAEHLLARYRTHDAAPAIDPARLAGFAAIEVMRRLIGVAQLPIPASAGERRRWLEAARSALQTARHEELFA